MYYSSGNYEAFARPKKPAGVDDKNAYIIGTGLAALGAAVFLVRDAQMPGDHIHIFEKDELPGGACDGREIQGIGYVMRGGRELDNHNEVMYDAFRSIPSLETKGASILDELYWLNKADPNFTMCRATEQQGRPASNGKFGLSDKATMEIMKLYFTPDEKLYNKKIEDIFDDEVFNSNFWLFWRTMFAFENWHSALEMKLYIKRFIHHVGGLPDFTALRFSRYNQYESFILPMVKYLEKHGVQFHYRTKVNDVKIEVGGERVAKRPVTGTGQDAIQRIQQAQFKRNPYSTDIKKVAKTIEIQDEGGKRTIELSENDYLFITPGGCVENATIGSQNEPAAWDPDLREGGGWDMWRRIARQDKSFGHPEKFCGDPNASKWMSATITTLDDQIPPYIQNICRRDPFSGRTVTGGIVSVKDSSWLMSWTLNRQQQFKDQPKNQLSVWVYGLFPDKPGDYVKKPMQECTGREICMEWLYHMGVPAERIEELATNHANSVPVMMPYIDAFFMPREAGDRPDVVPDGAMNFAFLGQFAEEPRDVIFTTEYSMRTAMVAVYTLLNVDRGVPEVWNSTYDVRDLLNATVALRDGRPLNDMDMPFTQKLVVNKVLEAVEGTDLEKILREYKVVK